MPPAPSPGAHGASGAATPPSKPQSPLRITHEGEFYARLLTRESSLGNPSFRYYGAGTGAVPFVWESQPGTPKDAYSCRMLAAAAAAAAVAPVITPPPSYYLHGVPLGRANRRHGKTTGGYKYKQLKWVKLSFIATVFRRLAFGNKSRPSSAAAAAVKSSSSSSSSSARWLFSGSSAAEARDQECCGYDDPAAAEPRTKGAVLCLGIRATPWMVQFCGGQREQAGWVYGWRP